MAEQPKYVEQKIEAKDSVIKGVTQVVVEHLTLGITRLPTDYASRIQNFLIEYLGTPEQPVPFGGRDADLARLDTWLADPQSPPYSVLAAPAGRGKSALLVHWSQRLLTREGLAVVLIPVSIRFRTNLASVVFSALAAFLAHFYGEGVTQTTDLTAEQWRGLVSTYLARPLPDGRSLLLILDGVDEAADWEPGPDLFPLAPPPGLRVIVSARYRAGDADASPWLHRLGWERPGLAWPLDLHPLVQDGVADVLQKMGFPLDVLARDVDIVTGLHRLSEGDPLLVRLYVDDLWVRGEAAARLRPEDLQAIRPGLEGYFDRWWEDQRRLWGEKAPLRQQMVQAPLNLLACALGPLNREDVLALAGDVGLTTWTLEEALRPLARFVIGDGKTQGYVFGHPRLGEYFHGRLADAERLAWEQRFLDWGRQTLAHLEDGTLAPEEAPAYVVQYYGAHLERRGGPAESLFALVSDGWRRAWEALEGAHSGFLTDVERAWRAAEAVNSREAKKGCPAPHLGVEVHSALCRTSVNSLAKNIPPALLLALVKQGVWTSTQSLAYARHVPELRQRVEALAELAPHLPESERTEALREALAAAREMKDKWDKAKALVGLLPHLPETLLRKALAAARAMRDKDDRAEALAELVPHLPEPLLREALATARELPEFDEWGCEPQAKALAALAPRLAEFGYPDEAMDIVQAIWWREYLPGTGEYLSEMLVGLAPHLPEPLLQKALVTAWWKIEWEGDWAKAIAGLAPHLPEVERAEALGQALAAARAIEEEGRRVEALTRLAPHLSEVERADALREALAAAREIESENDRTRALVGLASHLPEVERAEVLREALAAAREIEWESDRAKALMELAPHLPKTLLQKALTAAREIEWEDDRTRALARLAPHLPEALLREALAAVRTIEDERWRAEALAGLAPYLPEPLLQKALAIAWEIKWESDRAEALAGLAPYLPEVLLRETLATAQVSEQELERALAGLAPRLAELGYPQEALATAWEIEWEGDRAKALAGLAPHLPEALLREALAAARVIEDEEEQVGALVGLALHLAELGHPQEALAAAREIEWEDDRTRALARLAPHLPEALLREALAAAQAIEGEWERVMGLAGLAPCLPEAERAEVLREALAVARAIRDKDDRAEALAELAPHLPEAERAKALREALVAAQDIGDEYYRAEALARLAPHLPEALLREALAAAQEIENENDRTRALAGLAPHLPEALLQEALAAVRTIEDEGWRAEALAGLASYLPEALLREALAAAQAIGDEKDRARALAGLAPHLPEALLREALAAAQAIGSVDGWAEALAGLAPRLAELGHSQEALSVAQTIWDDYYRAEALVGLAPHLPEPLLREGLAAAQAMRDEWDTAKVLAGLAPYLLEAPLHEALAAARATTWEWQAEALAGLAPHLPEAECIEVLWEALAAARETDEKGRREEVLAGLAPHLAQLPRQRLYLLWQETLPILATRTRKDLLADLRALEPVIAALGGAEAVVETFRAIQDVGRWWP